MMLKLKLQYFGHLIWRADTLENLWCWEGLGAGEKVDDRGWDGWMASQTRWMWVWVNSGSWWWTGKPGVLRFTESQRVRQDWASKLNWTELIQLKVKVLIAQSGPILENVMDYSSPGSSVHAILQASILKWVAIPFSRISSWEPTWVSYIVGRFLSIWVTKEKCIQLAV